MARLVLKVTPEQLKTKATVVEKQIQDVEKAFDEIEKVIKASKKYWIGDASDKHVQSFEELTDDISTVIKRLKEHPVDLQKMAGVYEEVENSVQQMAAALPTDIF